MASFQSSFHPVFWMHHNNVDRLYEAWLAELARLLTATGFTAPDTPLLDALLAFQTQAGLTVDGSAGARSMAMLQIYSGMSKDAGGVTPGTYSAGTTVCWCLDESSVPKYLAKAGDVAAELQKAFDVWGKDVTDITFEKVPMGDAKAQITVQWSRTSSNDSDDFDGPGGALADATATSITFDADECWELTVGGPRSNAWVPETEAGAKSGDDFWREATVFKLLPVAMHEVGHTLGLSHTKDPADVMSPFYSSKCTTLTPVDIAAVKAAVGAVSVE